MNYIGIIGAMEEEVSQLKGQMTEVEEKVIASMTFCRGKLQEKDVVVVRSGIGKVNMAICAQILIDVYQVGMLINTGVAGSLQNKIDIGDMVISTDTLQHDIDATGFGYPTGVIPRMETSVFQADPKLIALATKACQEVNPDINVFEGRVVSGDQFVSSQEKKDYLVKQFQGYCTEMEGAAMGQAAYLNSIPFVVIRAISDKADQSAEISYEQFEAQAIVHTIRLIKAMLVSL